MPRTAMGCVGGMLALSLVTGCQNRQEQLQPWRPPEKISKEYGRPLAAGELALRKIDPADYPDFSPGYRNADGLADAIRHSLTYLAKPSSRKYYPYGDITHARAVASLETFLDVIGRVESADELDAVIRRDFEVYQSVGWDRKGTVYFTGYYCPIFDGRKQRDAVYRHPLYGLPDDLIKDSEGRILGRRLADGSVRPRYFTRGEIERRRILEGLEIAWLSDAFQTYVVTVQGSAKLRLEDGSLFEIGYAGNNGHEYSSVGLRLVSDGVIRRDDLSLQTLLRFFAEHPEQIDAYCHTNDRYVFFKETIGGPFGSINVPVIPYRSIATDKEVFPRACLAFVDTIVPTATDAGVEPAAFGSFALDQDTGGAIRAAGRCDIYMGEGAAAEALAGRAGAEGRLYYLFLKP